MVYHLFDSHLSDFSQESLTNQHSVARFVFFDFFMTKCHAANIPTVLKHILIVSYQHIRSLQVPLAVSLFHLLHLPIKRLGNQHPMLSFLCLFFGFAEPSCDNTIAVCKCKCIVIVFCHCFIPSLSCAVILHYLLYHFV